jgi:hypothetical protein
MANILAWAERNLKTVEENGHALKCIRLASVEGQTWERWDAPFAADPAEFVREVETVTNALAEEWPTKKIQLLLIGEDAQGTIHAQCPFTVWGKNKEANKALMGGDGSRALAEGMEAIVRTTERALAVANTQMRLLSEFNEKLLTANHDLLDLMRVKEEQQALMASQTAETSAAITGAIKEHLPLLVNLAERMLTGKGGSAGKVLNGVKTAAAVVAQTPPTGD